MKSILPFLITIFVAVQAKHLLDAQAKVVPPSDVNTQSVLQSLHINESNTDNSTRSNRQIADEDDIDTDGPYGYIPRVVHGVNKIVKGILNGSVHSVFHGAFGIAPDDVADDLVGTYNQIMGIPDPDDLDLDETTEKTENKKKPVKTKPSTVGKVKSKDQSATLAAASPASASPIDVGGTKTKTNKKKPLASKVDEEEDDEDDDEDDI